MFDFTIERIIPMLILTVGKKVSPESLELACIEAGKSLGYDPQAYKDNGFPDGDRIVVFNTPYSWPFQIKISGKVKETDRMEVWTGNVYNRNVESKIMEYSSKVSECLEKRQA